MFILEKTIDVHGEGLKVSGYDAPAANHSSLPELKSQGEVDRAGVSSAQPSALLLVLQRLDNMRIPHSFVGRGRVQFSSSPCPKASAQ
ncbi:MAG: hypothetical protein WBV78_20985 [Roseobacter sp.]|jgi:hypothetical protein